MIEFFVSGQSLKFYTPVIAADSLNYLTAKVNFASDDWSGASKWLHFRRDEGLGAVTYEMQLDENDCISPEQKLNLTVGQWEIYLTGTRDDSRLTTVPVILTVKESGLVDAPLHELPMSVAEQVDYTARQALLYAQSVKQLADSGALNGKDGTSLSPLGHFSTPEELAALIPEPAPGDVYSVGEALPYDIYVWDGISLIWRNHGQLQGPQGERGADGVSFIPSVSATGNLSWTNDGGLENPPMLNIMGPAGHDGETGPAGPGAYEKAQQAGYTGTEETFYSALTMMPYHNRRHLPDGADPITVSGAMLAADAKSKAVALALAADAWAENSQTVAVEGVTDSNNVLVAAAPESRTAYNDAEIYCSAQSMGALTFKCGTAPTADVSVNVVILV